MSKYARNVDKTHAPIRDALRKAGFRVIDCSRVGNGFPDLIVHGRLRTILVECKTSRNKSGTVEPKRVEESQVKFMRDWAGGPIVMATSPAQAVSEVAQILARIGA